MLKYSREAQELKRKFYASYNNINIFVEDEDDEIFYEELLQKLVDNRVQIARVFGVGGKQNLLNKLSEYIENPKGENSFFIADGDFSRIINACPQQNQRLHILDEYDIENYLLEEHAICIVIQEENPSNSLGKWKELLNFPTWLEETVNSLTPLFVCFIVIQKYDLGEANINVGIGEFITAGRPPLLDVSKIDAYVARFRKDHGKQIANIVREMSATQKKMGNTWRERKKYICGKKYLFPLLLFEIRGHCGRSLNRESLRFRLVKHCKFDSLSPLQQQIENLCQ